jgi:hypothetical protein
MNRYALELINLIKLYNYVTKNSDKADLQFFQQIIVNGDIKNQNHYGIIHYVNVLNNICRNFEDFEILTIEDLIELIKILKSPDNIQKNTGYIAKIIICLVNKIYNFQSFTCVNHSENLSQDNNTRIINLINEICFTCDLEKITELVQKNTDIINHILNFEMKIDDIDKFFYYKPSKTYIDNYNSKSEDDRKKQLNKLNSLKNRMKWKLRMPIVITAGIIVCAIISLIVLFYRK